MISNRKKIKSFLLLVGIASSFYFLLPNNNALAQTTPSDDCGCGPVAPVTQYTDVFTLQIPIPGLLTNFQPAEIQGEPGSRYFYLPWIGQYVAAIYQYTLGIVGIIATVVIVWAGIVWLTAAGNAEKIKMAQEYIGGAIIGLVLAFGSYLILYTLNPDLVNFEALRLKVVERIETPDYLIERDVPGVSRFEIPTEYYNDLVDISNKVGVKSCMLATHFYMESGFSPTTATSCCYGFGQTHINTIREWLGGCGGTGKAACDTDKDKREACAKRTQLRQFASDPSSLPCPTEDDATITSWFTKDIRANIAVAALYRKSSEASATNLRPFSGGRGGGPGPYNAVTVLPIYGMGVGTVRAFANGTGCLDRPRAEIALSNEDLQTKLLDGSLSIDAAIQSACVPGVNFPIPKVKDGKPTSADSQAFCNNGTGSCCKCDTRDTPEGIAACELAGGCEQPTFTDKGRWGICKQSGADDGKPCVAGGGDRYARAWLGSLKTCLQKYPELK